MHIGRASVGRALGTAAVALALGACATLKAHQPAPVTAAAGSYRYTVNLRRLDAQHRLRVRVDLPASATPTALFVLPKLVPGIYGALNQGQYVRDLRAFDQRDRPLAVTRQDTNSWRIADARRLHHLTYAVAATWPEFVTPRGQRPPFYRSAGSSYHPDSAFVLNYSTFTGYLQGQAEQLYRVQFTKPAGFYGASYLPPQPLSDSTEVVTAPSYRELVDAPVLYARPDTAWLHLGGTQVLVALYDATSHARQAPAAARALRPLLDAQRAYLGGALPVSSYAFLLYHVSGPVGVQIGDGLEHTHSTLCLLESPDVGQLGTFARGIASHEFFHIVTPLNIHAEQLEHFDFRQPTFSEHLWLYEGLTEYETIHLPIREKLETLPEFLHVVSGKAQAMQRYNDTLALTRLSRQALTRQDQHYNFYLKGALFNLCLDIRLRELSGGQLGTQQLTQRLLQCYGPHHPFHDEELFGVLTELTYPSMRAFFHDYLEEGRPLPLAETLAKVGLRYDALTATVSEAPTPTPAQLALRWAWLGQ